jgi:hypothetical protein
MGGEEEVRFRVLGTLEARRHAASQARGSGISWRLSEHS